jgi:Nuclease-related domain
VVRIRVYRTIGAPRACRRSAVPRCPLLPPGTPTHYDRSREAVVLKSPRWTYVSPSGFAWERDVLEFLREHLPDYDPWMAWSNVEFIDDVGRVNEVDCLVLTPRGLILIEIKSRPGILKGDAHTWTWKDNGRLYSSDNPLLLANRKAKRLASLLGRQDAFRRSHTRVPYVDSAIFLSAVHAEPDIDPGSKTKVFLRGNPGKPLDRGIVAALTDPPAGEIIRSPVDSSLARTTRRALEQAGVRPALRSQRVADYELGAPLAEGEGWQDFVAKHVSLPNVTRRIRLYPFARASSKEERGRLSRMADREFRVLEGIVPGPGCRGRVDLAVAAIADRPGAGGAALRSDWWFQARRAAQR